MANKNGVIVQSVQRSLKILKLFEENGQLSLNDISEYMELSKSTVYGLVNTLVCEDFLEQNDETKKYKLGIKNFELGNYYQKRLDIRKELRPLIENLVEQFHETVHLARHYHGEVIYIDKVEGSDFSIVSSQIAQRAPMHCTGVGKVQLAHLPDEYLEDYIFSKPLKKYTDKTITTKELLKNELMNIRNSGYAFDNEEIEVGLRCVAVAILGHDGKPMAAVSISAPTGRMSDSKRLEMLDVLLKYSKSISKKFGYVE